MQIKKILKFKCVIDMEISFRISVKWQNVDRVDLAESLKNPIEPTLLFIRAINTGHDKRDQLKSNISVGTCFKHLITRFIREIISFCLT